MSKLPTPTASARVIRGVKTNRMKRSKSPGSVLSRYRKDPTTRGFDCTTVCISVPVAELAEMDAFAERCQMARSHMIRQAVKHFIAKVGK